MLAPQARKFWIRYWQQSMNHSILPLGNGLNYGHIPECWLLTRIRSRTAVHSWSPSPCSPCFLRLQLGSNTRRNRASSAPSRLTIQQNVLFSDKKCKLSRQKINSCVQYLESRLVDEFTEDVKIEKYSCFYCWRVIMIVGRLSGGAGVGELLSNSAIFFSKRNNLKSTSWPETVCHDHRSLWTLCCSRRDCLWPQLFYQKRLGRSRMHCSVQCTCRTLLKGYTPFDPH